MDTTFSAALLLVASPFVGSFVALCGDRLPRGRPVLGGRSCCDGCGRPLGPTDLVPIVSFLAARGRSRCCGVPLRPYLPAVELAALGLAAWGLAVVDPVVAWPTAALGWTLLLLAIVDLRSLRLPTPITAGLAAGGLGTAAAGLSGPLAQHALAAAVGWLAFAGLGEAFRRVRGREGLGRGDATLFAAAGAWVGPAALPTVALWGALATLAGLALSGRLATARGRRRRAPFGPGLALGIWLVWLYGPLRLG